MLHSYPNIVFGYHGCDRKVGEAIVAGKEKLTISKNKYDWLGSGIYFWENAPSRALDWAKQCAHNPHLSRGIVNEPFVVGAIIDLGLCLNLMDFSYVEVLKKAYSNLKQTFDLIDKPLPKNEGNMHGLDCAVINTAVALNLEDGNKDFDTVRGAYIEGSPVYPQAQLYDKTHIQISVRNPACIIGYFSFSIA